MSNPFLITLECSLWGQGRGPLAWYPFGECLPPLLLEAVGGERKREEGRQTHVSVVVIQLHHNAGWLLGDAGWLTKDLNLIEDECLVPSGVQSVLCHHCLLALVQEGDDGVGIWVGQTQGGAGWGGAGTAETVRVVCSGVVWATELEQSHGSCSGWGNLQVGACFPSATPSPHPSPL